MKEQSFNVETVDWYRVETERIWMRIWKIITMQKTFLLDEDLAGVEEIDKELEQLNAFE